MSVNTTAVLICQSGELAGTRFDLGARTLIGRDAKNRVSITVDARELVVTYVQILLRDGTYVLESLTDPGMVALDGAAVRGTVALDRRHVIELPGGLEFVYSRSSPGPQPPPPEPVPARSDAPRKGKTPRETVVDQAAFGDVPALGEGAPRSAPPVIRTGPRAKQSPRLDPGTIIDSGGFGDVPVLAAKPAARKPPPASAPPSAPSSPPLAPPPSPPTPGARAASAAATDDVIPPPAVPPLELTATLPDHGPMTFPLKFGENVIGRGQRCDITVPDPKNWLSRTHAIIRVSSDRVELVDLGGMNGTFVSGDRIDTAHLRPGSTFSLGPHLEFTLRKR